MEPVNTSGDWSRFARLSREERLQSFIRKTIAHQHFVAASQALQNAIREPGGTLLIFVCGPTGVGKTTLKNYELRPDGQRAPILGLLAKPPLHGSFSWREFLQNGIAVLEQPSIGSRGTNSGDTSEENSHLARPNESWLDGRPLKRMVDDDLRISLETALKRWRPAAVIIDDAQHLGRVSGKRQLQDQLDCLKSMAEATETAHVLIGTYELLKLYDVGARSTARSSFVHFPRYGSTDEELTHFKRVLGAFQHFLPFEEETDLLLKHWEFCYERSLGCVGTLQVMLARAVYAALWAGERTLGQAYLERCALSEAECFVMIREVHEAERDLACRSAPTDLRQLLGLAPHTTFSPEKPATRRRTTSRRRVLGPKRVWSE